MKLKSPYMMVINLQLLTSKNMPTKKKSEKNLAESLAQLEQIVAELDSDSLDIEKSLKKFKEGSELIKFCKQKFKKAENEFIKLKKDLESEFEN